MRLMNIALVTIAMGAPLSAQSSDPTMGTLAPAVQTALNRGTLLYVLDEAAWHGTDDLRDNFPELLKQAGGYVVTGGQSAADVVFYDKSATRAVYRARYSFGKKGVSGPPALDGVALTPVEQQLITAKTVALAAFGAAKVALCSNENPNLSFLPPERVGGPVIAYLMTPRTSMSALPLGGHYSVEIATDGKPGKIRAFTNSCVSLPLVEKGKSKPTALMISHLLDPTPTEIHVFSSMTGKVPIYVMTTANARLWSVEKGSIRIVSTDAKSKAKKP